MKKYILMILAAAMFIGCAKKNDVKKKLDVPSSIVGKWYFVKDTLTFYENGALLQQSSGAKDHTDFYQFNSDNTGSLNLYDVNNVVYPQLFTYTLVGTALTIVIPTQIVNGNNDDGRTLTGTILNLTDTDLHIFFEEFYNDQAGAHRTTEADYLTK